MVVVAVGQHRQVRLSQVDAQRRRVPGKQVGLAHVKEDPVAQGLDPQRQAVLFAQRLAGRGVFHQCCDLHAVAAFLVGRGPAPRRCGSIIPDLRPKRNGPGPFRPKILPQVLTFPLRRLYWALDMKTGAPKG